LDEIRQGAAVRLKRRNKNGNHKKGSPAIKAGEPFLLHTMQRCNAKLELKNFGILFRRLAGVYGAVGVDIDTHACRQHDAAPETGFFHKLHYIEND
jgi:hypothetical protein